MSIRESLKIAREYRKDPLGFIQSLHLKHGHRVVLNVFGRKMIILTSPNDVLHVLKEKHSLYSKGRTTKKLVALLGKGLITNEGEDWRKQHRLIRPLMNLKSVYQSGPKIEATTQEFIQELSTKVEMNSLLEMNRLTWRIVLNTLFSQKASPEMDTWLDEILFIMDSVTKRTRASIPIPFWFPTPNNLRLKRAIHQLDNYVYKLIHERRTQEKKHDLLQVLIDAQHEGGTSGMSDLQIKDEVMTFLMAGHETITNALTWILIELSKHKKYLPELRAEAAEFIVKNDYEKLNNSSMLTAVIDEVMRLWPPVWVFMRQAEFPDAIDTLDIPKKANVIVSPFFTHRSPDFWNNPEEFMPERFLAEERKKIIPGSYYPYGLGPRTCIGSYFAGMEAKIILAHFVHNFDWEVASLAPQTHIAGITLRPSNNIMMNLRRRERA